MRFRDTTIPLTLVAVCLAPCLARGQDIDKIVEILTREPPATAADGTDAAKKAVKPARKAVPIFLLRDKSRVTGTPQLEQLLIDTKYGELAIPFAQLARIRFAMRIDPSVQKRASELIKLLGDDDFDTRETAMANLLAMGPAVIELLRAAATSDDEELQNRAALLVSELEEKQRNEQSDDEASARVRGTDDEVQTDRMTVRGRVLSERFTIDSKYGRLEIDVADLLAINFKPTGESEKSVDVEATCQPPGSWLDTKIDIEKGQRLQILASGQTSVPDWGLSSGPAGNTQYSGNTFGGFPNLSLVGKIGKKGKPFLVGASYKVKSKARGRLLLAIVPFQYDPGQTSGKYIAKIHTGAMQ